MASAAAGVRSGRLLSSGPATARATLRFLFRAEYGRSEQLVLLFLVNALYPLQL